MKRQPTTRARNRLIQCCLGTAGLVCVAGAASDCLAADRSWANGTGGTFGTTTNWENGIVAGVNDVACFNLSSSRGDRTYTVTFGASVQNQALKVKNDSVTFSLSGRTYTTTQTTGNEIGTVGGTHESRDARLTIQNGVFNVTGPLTPQIVIGSVPDAIGVLALVSNGVLTGSPRVFVGTASATGAFTVNGGTATLSLLDVASGVGGHGNAVVTGPFATVTSSSLILGNAGAGTMLIDIAGVFTNNGTATIGNLAGSTGHVTVDNSSRWSQQNGLLTVGSAGAGTVNVTNGGSLTGSTAVLGAGTTGTATVRVGGAGSGSRWTNAGTLTVADFGQATLNIDGGGFVSAGSTTIIGRSAGSAGTINIGGAGSTATFGPFIVGNAGTATVNVTGGGVLNAGTTVMGNNSGGTSTMNVSGAGSGATFPRLTVADVDSATINITDGGRLTCLDDTDIGFTFNSPAAVGRVNVTGNGSRWINAGQILLFSGQGNGINISGGGTVQCNAAAISGSGGFTVDGAGSRWLNTGSLNLDTSMTISNGGVVENTNAAAVSKVRFDSFARVQGAGSTWNNAGTLEVGGFDSVLIISAGGHVQAANTLVATDGTISISSTGSDLTTGDLTLGFGTNSGSERLFVQFGGSVHSQSAKLAGHNSTVSLVSSATIRDFGSFWQNAGSLIVGGDGLANFPGHAKLDVLNAGSVTNGNAFVAISPSSTGTVTVGGVVSSTPARWTTNGNLYVGGSTLSAGGAGTVIINSGGNVAVTDTLTVWDDGVVNLNGGSLVVGSMAFPGSTFNFLSGTLRLTGDVQLNSAFLDKTLGPGHVIKLLQQLSIGGTPTLTSPLILDGGILTVPTLAPGSPLQFDGGTFNLTTANLTIGTDGLLGSTVTLDDRNINVTNATTIQPGGELIMQGGSFSFGAGITNNGLLAVNATANVPNAVVNNGEFRVATGATASFVGSVTGVGSFTGGGTKRFRSGSNAVLGAIDTPGGTDVQAGATLTIDRIRENTLIVSGNVNINPNGANAAASHLSALSIIGGRFDLNDNDLIVTASPLAVIRNFIATARNGGAWDGAGLTSSTARNHPQHATTLGVLSGAEYVSINGTTFDGFTVAPTHVLVKYTWYGDADLNGLVNFDDYSRIDNGFSTNKTGWLNGDFDLNGIVDFDDYSLIDLAFNTQSGTLRRAMSYLEGHDRSDKGMNVPSLQLVQQHFAEFGNAYASSLLNAVPEPSCVVLSAAAVSLLRCRRRRRRCG